MDREVNRVADEIFNDDDELVSWVSDSVFINYITEDPWRLKAFKAYLRANGELMSKWSEEALNRAISNSQGGYLV